MTILTLKRLLLITTASISLIANQAFSATIIYQFDGQILGADLGGIPDGTPYFGEFSYEDDSPNLGTNPDIGVYEYNYFEVTIGSETIFADLSSTASGTPPRIFINNFPSSDSMNVNANPAGGSVGTYASVLGFNVAFSDSDVFDDTSLPGPDLTIDDFQFSNFSALATLSNGVQVNFGGTVDSLQAIPIPASIWLLATGFMGLIGVARRRKAT